MVGRNIFYFLLCFAVRADAEDQLPLSLANVRIKSVSQTPGTCHKSNGDRHLGVRIV